MEILLLLSDLVLMFVRKHLCKGIKLFTVMDPMDKGKKARELRNTAQGVLRDSLFTLSSLFSILSLKEQSDGNVKSRRRNQRKGAKD